MRKMPIPLLALFSLLLTTAFVSEASMIFRDSFTQGSTLNSLTPAIPTAISTSYQLLSGRAWLTNTPTLAQRDLRFGIDDTTSGVIEVQALFAPNPISLTGAGDFITLTVVFTNTAGLFVSPCNMGFGLYNSGQVQPVPGGMNGTTTTASTNHATGNAQNWQGYVGQISYSGLNSRIMTRGAQTGSANNNQDLVTSNSSSQSYLNPSASTVGSVTNSTLVLTEGAVYTETFTITRAASGDLNITNALYSGPDTSGTVLAYFGRVATGGQLLATGFDGLAVGWRESGGLATAIDISSIVVTSSRENPHNPVIWTHPASQLVSTSSTVTFSVTAYDVQALNYQWLHNGYIIPGANSSSLTLNSVTTASAGSYSVLVWNTYGSVTSHSSQLSVTSPIALTITNRIVTGGETTPPVLVACPISTNQLKKFVGGSFVSNLPLDSSRMTVVLTHGWKSDPDQWAKNMAAAITAQFPSLQPNIVAWDWSCAASTLCSIGSAAKQTPGQGTGLGEALYNRLGALYSKPIHFVGHSLGTLVTANAADYLHSHGYSPTNTHMTLFDEAEIGTEFGCLSVLGALYPPWDPFLPKPYYLHPIPTSQSAWVDNFVSFAGLLHVEARNVILTNGLPSLGATSLEWVSRAIDFHAYPYSWYRQTISNINISAMGCRWSFENGGFAGSPTNGSVYLQTGSEFNLLPISYSDGSNMLSQRIDSYRRSLSSALATSIENGVRAGAVSGSLITANVNLFDAVVNLATASGGGSLVQSFGPRPQGGDSSTSNVPALVWLPLTIPSNSISMSFDFVLQGDGRTDCFAAALKGTNVSSVPVSTLQTNTPLNSGLIDVAAYAGSKVELFLGVVGGTSTNVSVTVSNFQFYLAAPPSMQSQRAGNSVVVSWPLSASDYTLETCTALNGTNLWTLLTNSPAIVDSRNTITNSVSSGARFYRLKK